MSSSSLKGILVKKTSYGLCQKTKPTPPERQLDFSDKKFAKKVAKDLVSEDKQVIKKVFNANVVKINGFGNLYQAVASMKLNVTYNTARTMVMDEVGCCVNLESIDFNDLIVYFPQHFDNYKDQKQLALIFSRLKKLIIKSFIDECAMMFITKTAKNLKSLTLLESCSRSASFEMRELLKTLLRSCTRLEEVCLGVKPDFSDMFSKRDLLDLMRKGHLKSLKKLSLICTRLTLEEEETIKQNCPKLEHLFVKLPREDKFTDLLVDKKGCLSSKEEEGCRIRSE